MVGWLVGGAIVEFVVGSRSLGRVREDGCEFGQFLLLMDLRFVPIITVLKSPHYHSNTSY